VIRDRVQPGLDCRGKALSGTNAPSPAPSLAGTLGLSGSDLASRAMGDAVARSSTVKMGGPCPAALSVKRAPSSIERITRHRVPPPVGMERSIRIEACLDQLSAYRQHRRDHACGDACSDADVRAGQVCLNRTVSLAIEGMRPKPTNFLCIPSARCRQTGGPNHFQHRYPRAALILLRSAATNSGRFTREMPGLG
jgi:hypothetical protein